MSWLIRPRPDAIPSGPVEARKLILDLLECQNQAEIFKIKVLVGNISLNLSELVQIKIIDGPLDEFHFEGDFHQYHGIGWKLQSGKVFIDGDIGSRTGAEMAGGSITIQGNCGSWAGTAMSGGRLFIHGNAGNWLGANWPGESKGMTGGEILVVGDVAENAGTNMRRGTIAIAGDACPGLASSMIAGSIFVAGSVSKYFGVGMKRGSIVISNHQSVNTNLLPSFSPDGDFRPLTLDMQLHYLAGIGWHAAKRMLKKRGCQRYFGDTLSLGLGEVITLTD
ncbi:MAG: formylmethanofuran dehydrogenase subunit C [Isosphaeraceae bacterium]